MMTDAVRVRMTADTFFALPESGKPMQLIDGDVVVNSPVPQHQTVVGNLYLLFRLRQAQVGGKTFIAPLDVYLDEYNVPQPDVLYLAPDTRCVVEAKRLSGAPDLIAEVLSPGTSKLDRDKKFLLYQRYGVREYWIIDLAEQTIQVWQHQDNRYVLSGVYEADESFESAFMGTVEAAPVFAL